MARRGGVRGATARLDSHSPSLGIQARASIAAAVSFFGDDCCFHKCKAKAGLVQLPKRKNDHMDTYGQAWTVSRYPVVGKGAGRVLSR